jgi:GNAT superfamily N-acetyltransferase
MIVEVRNSTKDFDSYRANRTKSLYNVDSGADFFRDFELPELSGDWTIGVVVGPSGSGKSSIGRALEAEGWEVWDGRHEWPTDRPIIDAITPDGDFDAATAALASVGLGDVPAWLRPHHVLSGGERFRSDLARVLAEQGDRIVIDEFTSVVDRQVAQIGAGAFSKSWRRGNKGERKAVLLTCHYDVLDWVDPDWVLRTEDGDLTRDARGSFQRPPIELEVVETGWGYWPLFKPHHYLVDAGPMPFSTAFVGFVDDQPVAHLGVSGIYIGQRREARACRMVVMPEWQGAGVGMRFLNHLMDRELAGEGFIGYPTQGLFHTNHPALAAGLRRDPKWRQISYNLHGGDRAASARSNNKSAAKQGRKPTGSMGWGGHFRGVQGFRYFGEAGVQAAARTGRGRRAKR